MNKTFEFECNGRTFTTQKLTQVLKGRVLRLIALSQRDIPAGTSAEEIQNTQWMQLSIASALYELGPDTLWDFLPSDQKHQAGSKQTFVEGLDVSVISAFFIWVVSCLNEASDFLQDTPVKAAKK